MQVSKLVAQARQGDATAIAALITQRLQPYGVEVKVRSQSGCLQLALIGSSAIDQTVAERCIRDTLQRLNLNQFHTVQIAARRQGEVAWAWKMALKMDWRSDAVGLGEGLIGDRAVGDQGAGDGGRGDGVADQRASSAQLERLRRDALTNVETAKQLLQQACGDAVDEVMVGISDRTLQIGLVADPAPSQADVLLSITTELQRWPSLVNQVETIAIASYQTDVYQPIWTETQPVSNIVQSFHPAGTDPVHVVRSQNATSAAHCAQSAQAAPSAIPDISWASFKVKQLDKEGQRAIAAGLGLGLLVTLLGQVKFLLHPLITTVHELGHAATNWLFGYFAIPAFDFIYGGGVTMSSAQKSVIIVTLMYLGLAYLFYRYWRNILTARLLLGLTLVYLLCAYTPIHQALIVGMGHGFELLFAIVFLYQSLSGLGCRTSIERPLYGMLGFYIVLYDIGFAWRLLTDSDMRAVYNLGKGGIDNDFVRLARDYLGSNLSAIAVAFLLGSLMVLPLAYTIFRYEHWIAAWLHRLFWITNDAKLSKQ
ncbi:MAG: hypothetical protein ACTS2F_10300 [Thainema sp.]